ncbi:chemotaxis protein CheW [Caulobacter mirabilis]|uniref:Chemotaxis protein CheW n=1 Tax=Caulobacter mirabilis TaxID=69666 RepID=A0A2D2B036_9CAUL|nr:chemotaxis protein CheW [Caulobacter mirabilis]ATQ43601.1 chemotaxis protein CheW [Caulobacter mirabilis]
MTDTTQDAVELISFEIGGQEFCIDISVVREIRGWSVATPMPQSPEFVHGIINLRGSIMPVIDLRARLGLGATEPSSRHVIVVVQDADRCAGLLVDGVQETFTVEATLPQAAPELGATVDERFVDAIIPMDGRMISRLIVSRLMPDGPRAEAA